MSDEKRINILALCTEARLLEEAPAEEIDAKCLGSPLTGQVIPIESGGGPHLFGEGFGRWSCRDS